MPYTPKVLPFRSRSLADGFVIATSRAGDHAFFSPAEFEQFRQAPATLPLRRQADLRGRFLLGDAEPPPGLRRLVASRIAAKRETVSGGPSLHIIVPTLQCAHSCRYCQVSRSLHDHGHNSESRIIPGAAPRSATPSNVVVGCSRSDPRDYQRPLRKSNRRSLGRKRGTGVFLAVVVARARSFSCMSA